MNKVEDTHFSYVLLLPIVLLGLFLVSAPKKELPKVNKPVINKVEAFSQRLNRWSRAEKLNKTLSISHDKQTLKIALKGEFVFKQNSANIRSESQAVLKLLVKKLNKTPFKIDVQSEVDYLPKNRKKTFPTAWEFSVIRASRVARFLKQEFDGAKDIRAIGAQSLKTSKPGNTVTLLLILPKEEKAKRQKKESLNDKPSPNPT